MALSLSPGTVPTAEGMLGPTLTIQLSFKLVGHIT